MNSLKVEWSPRLKFWIDILYLYGIPIFIFFLFLICSPHTVQGGDTGELVASAWGMLLPHPPGFPVFVTILAFFLKVFTIGTVFFRASVFSTLCACLSIHLVLRALQTRKLVAVGFICLLASQYQFWRFALLPDVFLFHFLLISVFLFSYLSVSKRSLLLKTNFLAFALATHPISLFAIPLWLSGFRRKQARSLLFHGILLAGILALTYGTLLLWQRNSAFSWGFIPTIVGFFHYLIRYDYGAFQLTAQGVGGIWFSNLWQFFLATKNFFVLFCFLFLSNPKVLQRNVWILFTFSLFLYVFLFFSLANLSPVGFGSEVISRFYLFPLCVLAWILVIMIQELPLVKYHKLKPMLFLGILFLAVGQYIEGNLDNNFARRHVIDGYARNLLEISKGVDGECRILLLDSDSIFGAVRYLQVVEGLARSTIVVNRGLLALPWYQNVLKENRLEFIGTKDSTVSLLDSFVVPNLKKCRLFASSWRNWDQLRASILSVGTEIKLGPAGVEFPPPIALASASVPLESRRYDIENRIYSQYANRAFIEGKAAEVNKNWREAAQKYNNALEYAPLCRRLKTLLCQMNEKSNDGSLEKCDSGYRNVFDDFYCPE